MVIKENVSQDLEPMVKECLTSCIQEIYPDFPEYVELSVFLGCLRALGIMQHSHHWQTKGETSYGDHLLFERIYKHIEEDVDGLGEKIVGLGCVCQTNYFKQLKIIHNFLSKNTSKDSYQMVGYASTCMIIVLGKVVMDSLKQKELLTPGLEQCVGNILDRLETDTYLLKQRIS
jgi:DNA-binding ferritin-like protein